MTTALLHREGEHGACAFPSLVVHTFAEAVTRTIGNQPELYPPRTRCSCSYFGLRLVFVSLARWVCSGRAFFWTPLLTSPAFTHTARGVSLLFIPAHSANRFGGFSAKEPLVIPCSVDFNKCNLDTCVLFSNVRRLTINTFVSNAVVENVN